MGILSRFKKELFAARGIYDQIDDASCPYFERKIAFNSDGFHHLRYNTSGSERPKQAQMHKFNLLPKAIEIIGKSGTVQQYRKQWGAVGRKHTTDGTRPVKEMQYWGFEGILGTGTKMVRIKAVVRQIGNGEPHFWSVMSDTDFKRKSNYKLATDDILDS